MVLQTLVYGFRFYFFSRSFGLNGVFKKFWPKRNRLAFLGHNEFLYRLPQSRCYEKDVKCVNFVDFIQV